LAILVKLAPPLQISEIGEAIASLERFSSIANACPRLSARINSCLFCSSSDLPAKVKGTYFNYYLKILISMI
jgi:hypothetical protein